MYFTLWITTTIETKFKIGGMKMNKKIVVTDCLACPMHDLNHETLNLVCDKSRKKICNLKEKKTLINFYNDGIPDWCELPNDEEKEDESREDVGEVGEILRKET